jgi:hypothetical protein
MGLTVSDEYDGLRKHNDGGDWPATFGTCASDGSVGSGQMIRSRILLRWQISLR